jgi:DNA-binding NarL/FixJ family response regulator
VIDRVKAYVKVAIENATEFPLCPIRALIIDLKMPRKNGLDVIEEVLEFYKTVMPIRKDKNRILIAPKFVIMTVSASNVD